MDRKRVFNDHIEYGHYVNRTAIGPLATANRRGARETRMTLRRQSRGISLTNSRPSQWRCSRIRMMPAPRCREAADRPARRKGMVHREPQLSARKGISKLLHYSAVRTIRTGNPAYSIASYWSSLRGGEWLKRGGQRAPAHRAPWASSEPV